MNYIQIVKNASYLPKKEITSEQIEQKLGLEKGYIEKRAGIKTRYYVENADETIESMAVDATKKLFTDEKTKENIGLIIVASTTTNRLMPGIANYIQKELKLAPCICLDILAGCSGYINAFDIAKMYIETGKVEKAIVVGVEILSKYTNKEDIGTAILLADGAGATLLEKTNERKNYISNIKAEVDNKNILGCQANQKLQMNGKEVYKYAVTKTVENINELLEKADEKIENIKYIVPHQSNKKIIQAIVTRLKINESKVFMNIENKGNTFCASIPIALEEMQEKGLLGKSDKIILLGYGGGLNTGSILLEI